VESAHVNLATEKATIQASSSVTRDSLIQAVTKAGFEAKSVHQTTESFQDKKILN
jgi:copper chaperone CopZ